MSGFLFIDEAGDVSDEVYEFLTSRIRKDVWCIHCGCHKDNKVICSSGRHNYSEFDKEANAKKFPYEIVTDYNGNIIHDGKTPRFTKTFIPNKHL